MAYGWHQIVNVRVIVQVAGPGLEYAEHSHLPAEEAGIGGKLLERGRRRAKQNRVQAALVLPEQITEGRRHREGHEEVRDGQQQRLLLGEPGLCPILLTGGAVAVAAGVILVAGDGTGAARREMAT